MNWKNSFVFRPLAIVLGFAAFAVTTFSYAAEPQPIRVNCGGGEYRDSKGQIWQADQAYVPGSWGYITTSGSPAVALPKAKAVNPVFQSKTPVAGTPDGKLYQDGLQGAVFYRFEHIPPGNYDVRFHYAELFYKQPGQRVMYGVGVQNENKIPIFDILKESPFATPLIKSFAAHVDESGLLEVNPGKYLNALEILPVSTPIALKPVGLALADGTAVGAVSTLHVPIGAKINLVSKESADIFYTADGADPLKSANARRYDGPMTVSTTMGLKVAARKAGWLDSPVSEFTLKAVPGRAPLQQVAAPKREERDLTGTGWKLWLDEAAGWESDTLYMPYDVYLPDMPNNAPTIGWREMYARYGKDIAVPASVEDYFAQGRRTWQYKGVSWFWRTVNVPADWKGKTVRLQVDNARLRAEIYVNEKLAGYDIVPETPFAFDISEFLNYGQENRLAIRITSPGGTRGWEDTPRTWGGYTFTSTKNFSGLGGECVW